MLVAAAWALGLVGKAWGDAPAWAAILLLIWPYTGVAAFNAQFTFLPLAALGIGYWLYTREYDVAAGLIMVFATIKPELAAVPLIAISIIALHNKRWRFLGALAAGGLVLFAVSMLMAGFWVVEWLQSLQRYSQYAQVVWVPGFTWSISPLLTAALGMIVLACILWMRDSSPAWFTMSIPLGLLVLPQTIFWGLSMILLVCMLVWTKRTWWMPMLVWGIGWPLFVLLSSDFWRWQSTLVSLSGVILVAVASHFIDNGLD